MLHRAVLHSVDARVAHQPAMDAWTWGVLLCVASALLTALGLVFQKYSHIQNECLSQRVRYYRQPVWLLGFVIFLVGQVINVWAMALTPQVMTSCLGAWSLIFNAAFARTLLGEKTRLPEIVAMAGMICGVVLVIYRTPSGGTADLSNVDSIVAALLDAEFLSLAGGLFLGLSLGYVVTHKYRPDALAVYWAVVSSALSGYTVAVFKGVSMLLALGRAPWGCWRFYAVLAAGGLLCAWQLHVLNMALRSGSAVVVVPTSFALGMLMQILTAHFAFKELRDFAGWQEASGFWLGIAVVLTCTAVMARSRISAEVEPDGSDEMGEGDVIGAKAEASEGSRLLSPLGARGLPPRVASGSLDPEAFRQSFEDEERVYIVPITPQSGVM